MRKSSAHSLGNLGELLAVRYLKNKGFEILERNYQNSSGKRLGEIDIIALERSSQELVFVEVKTRNFAYLGTRPEENITRSKLRKLNRIAEDYLRNHAKKSRSYRFDALSVFINSKDKRCRISHLTHIFL